MNYKKLLSIFSLTETRIYGNEPEVIVDQALAEQQPGKEVLPPWIEEYKEGAGGAEIPTKTQSQEPTKEVKTQKQESAFDFKSKFGLEETEVEQRIKEYETLKQDYDKVVSSSPYKTTYAEQIDKLMDNGVDFQTAVNYLSTDLDKIEGLDLLVADKIISHPSLKGKEEQLKNELAEQYKQGEWAEAAKVMDQLEFEKAVAEAKERQKKYLEDSIQPKRAEILAEKESAKNKQDWEKEFPSIVPKSLKYNVEGVEINFEIKDAKLEAQLNNIIQNLGGATKENVEAAKEYIENELLVANKEAIFKLIFNQGGTVKEKANLDELENTDKNQKTISKTSKPWWAE